MLTPRFSIAQDDKFVVVTIYAPFTHVAETEVFMDGNDFRFFSKPYFLRLHFPAQVLENDDASAKFDADSLSYVVKCPKMNQGENFPNLDMITELCKPKGSSVVHSGIEELDEDEEWYFEQEIPAKDVDGRTFGLGFGLKHKNVFSNLLEECQEVIDVKFPDKISLRERRELREEKEQKDFNADHYLIDIYEPSEDLSEILSATFCAFQETLNEEENLKLTEYSKKNINTKETLRTLTSLIDILYCYCYDLRTTCNEHSSESGWTISKLSPTIACSDAFESVKECVIACTRRSLIYPIFRHFELSKKIWCDVLALLKSGK